VLTNSETGRKAGFGAGLYAAGSPPFLSKPSKLSETGVIID